jgi:anti-sigma B factor antagonist
MDFGIEKSFDGSSWHVALSGEIDIYNSTDMKKQLNLLMDEHIADMYVDCKNLEYIDSTGLGALVGVLKNIKSHDKEMHLSHVKANILKLFRITNLDKVFIIEEGGDE